SATPGARKTIVRDVNRDGRPDILALFAQGDERIVSYTNRGNFSFDETILLRFSPVDGTSYFEIADFNGDGHFDILVTNGDNADYSPIIKPYHGVTIYENDGENVFTERWSFPCPALPWQWHVISIMTVIWTSPQSHTSPTFNVLPIVASFTLKIMERTILNPTACLPPRWVVGW